MSESSDKFSLDELDPRDAVHILPLKHIPLNTRGLKSGLLVKNARLEAAVEIFSHERTGSGQVRPENVYKFFSGNPEDIEKDQQTLRRLSSLSSFDVYSLRMSLRKLKIDVDSREPLTLSESRQSDLNDAVKEFLYPLVERIYGSDQDRVTSFAELVTMVARPNKDEALENLKKLADDLKVELTEIPDFLQDYGDMYLSIAYFEDALNKILPDIKDFLSWYETQEERTTMRLDSELMTQLKEAARGFTQLIAWLEKKLRTFRERFMLFWTKATADTYKSMKADLVESHEQIGAVLCGLTVKSRSLKRTFPNYGNNKTEFFRGEIFPGLEELVTNIENAEDDS